MGFTLKKIISMFLLPMTLGMILGLLAFLALCMKKYTQAKVYLFACLSWFFLISFAPFTNYVIEPLEVVYKKVDYSKVHNVKHILLLGGDFEARAYEVLRLYHKLEG